MNRTDNEIMFRCERDLLADEENSIGEVSEFIHDYYINKGKEVNNNFSFDNWKLVACWLEKFASPPHYPPIMIKTVPVWGRHSWRPDNLAFFLWVRYRWMIILLPIICLSMVVSVVRVWRKNKGGQRYIDTDGKIIAYFVTRAFRLERTQKLLDWIVKRDKDLKSWENIFSIYFPPEHYVLTAFNLNKESNK